jgi:UrcA family protein
MNDSKLRFGFPLAIALAMASAAAVAQQTDQRPEPVTLAGNVHQTTVGTSYDGIPIKELRVDRAVSYADLDLTTTSGTAELMRRVNVAAEDACRQVVTAYRVDLSDTDDTSCVSAAKDGGLKQANDAIAAARTNGAIRATQVNTD